MKGFSLVEVLFCVLIFAFLSVGLYGVLSTGMTIYMKDVALLDVQQQARNAMDKIVRDVRYSSSHMITNISTGSDRITFNTPAASGLQYYKSGTQLMHTNAAGVSSAVASDITTLSFSPSTGDVVTVVVGAQKTIYQQPVSFMLTQKVRLRNE